MKDDNYFMNEALKEAKLGLSEGGIPIGSVLVFNGKIAGRGHNKRVQTGSDILHAEMDCIQNAGNMTSSDYKRSTIYSTLSPCDMCTGAILLYKIPRIVIGENSNFKGPEEYSKSRGVEILNLDIKECKDLMLNFIKNNPHLWGEDIGK